MPTVKSLNAHLVVQGATQALAFYQKAFGATVVSSMPNPDGRIMHAVLDFGGPKLFLVDEFPENLADGGRMIAPQTAKGTTVSIVLDVDDADAVFDRAVKAGATAHMPVDNMFWGARYGQVLDPYGHLWEINQQVEQRTPEQMKAAMAASDTKFRD